MLALPGQAAAWSRPPNSASATLHWLCLRARPALGTPKHPLLVCCSLLYAVPAGVLVS